MKNLLTTIMAFFAITLTAQVGSPYFTSETPICSGDLMSINYTDIDPPNEALQYGWMVNVYMQRLPDGEWVLLQGNGGGSQINTYAPPSGNYQITYEFRWLLSEDNGEQVFSDGIKTNPLVFNVGYCSETIPDTTFITIVDTVTVEVVDTSYLTIIDTTYTEVFDTSTTFIFDTIPCPNMEYIDSLETALMECEENLMGCEEDVEILQDALEDCQNSLDDCVDTVADALEDIAEIDQDLTDCEDTLEELFDEIINLQDSLSMCQEELEECIEDCETTSIEIVVNEQSEICDCNLQIVPNPVSPNQNINIILKGDVSGPKPSYEIYTSDGTILESNFLNPYGQGISQHITTAPNDVGVYIVIVRLQIGGVNYRVSEKIIVQ